MNFQEMILALQSYWSKQGCIMMQPYDVEKGAGTMNPNTILRSLGPEPWSVCYVEPSRRPADGRYGENPNRLKALREVIASVEEFRAETLEHAIHGWIEQNELPMGQVMNTFRLAVVGRSMGPSMMEIAEFIGREETIQRIDSALDKLGNPAQA